MTDHPFPGIDRRSLHRRAIVGAIVAVVTSALMLVLDQSLRARGAGIIDLELADLDRTRTILRDWGPAGCDAEGFGCTTGDIVWRAKASVLIDFVFLAAYGLGGAAFLAALAEGRRDRAPWVPRALGTLAWAMLFAAMFDALENAMLWQVLVLHPEGFTNVATASAVAKFVLIGVVLLATPTILLVGRRVRTDHGRETPTP